MTFADRYRRWFEYEKDVNARVLASIQAVPEALRKKPEYQRAVDLVAHMVAARSMWLYRMGVSAIGPASIDELEPHGIAPSALPGLMHKAEEAWSTYLSTLTDAELARRLEYRSIDAGAFSNTIEEIVTQLFGHGWYHRGQIGTLLRSIGAQPAPTDFILWARQGTGSATQG